jgi:hypothetical protein
MDKLIALALGVALIAFFFWPRQYRRAGNKSPKYETELLSRCLNDRGHMERLIKRELKRNPRLSREEACRDAVESHRRDNR